VVHRIIQTIKNVGNAGRGFMSEQYLCCKEKKGIVYLMLTGDYEKKWLRLIGYEIIGVRKVEDK
jgi:hypothetical protein